MGTVRELDKLMQTDTAALVTATSCPISWSSNASVGPHENTYNPRLYHLHNKRSAALTVEAGRGSQDSTYIIVTPDVAHSR